MTNRYTHVPYKETGYFSRLVNDYLDGDSGIQPFVNFPPDAAGIDEAIVQRQHFPVDRHNLVAAINRQYEGIKKSDATSKNMALLLQENTYTICTAHQPNLLTGYLYFAYKILHAIKLAEKLTEKHPGMHFVPVYYMGSEDNDLEELGTFRFRGEKFVWDGGGQSGAVGRMSPKGLKELFKKLFHLFGPPGNICTELETILTDAYLKHATIGEATRFLVNELFGRYGLIVLDPDDASLKASFTPVMQDELLHQHALPVIAAQIGLLENKYKIQAHPRAINLFYLADQLRERIEKRNDKWVVLNTDITWHQEELLKELHEHPERFSPNVMLRGLYQETILPNVVFIGGGAEVAYWLQLNSLFAHYGVFFPSLQLRQSVMWVHPPEQKLIEASGFSMVQIFKRLPELEREYIAAHMGTEWQTKEEHEEMEAILTKLRHKAEKIDSTLGPATGAALTKIKYQLEVLEKKMLRAEKKKTAVQLDRLARLKTGLFPGDGLQERIENFMEYYLDHGPSFFDMVKDGIEPLAAEFLVIE